MFCIDWDDPEVSYDVFGHLSSLDWQWLEFLMTPCNYVHREAGDIGDFVPSECITDPEEQFKYLSTSIQMLVLHNSEKIEM